MKTIVSLLLAVAAVSATAAEPPYIPAMSGLAVASLFEKDAFQFVPGQIKSCTHGMKDNLIMRSCQLEGASSTISRPSGERQTITWRRVLIVADSTFPKVVEYTFVGDWSETLGTQRAATEVSMQFSRVADHPRTITGDISLQRYGIHYGVEGTFTDEATPIP